MHFAVIAPLSTVARRARLVKMMPVLKTRGLDVVFYGWERNRGEAANPDESQVEERIIFRGGGNNTRYIRFMYPFWMVAVFFRVMRFDRDDVLLCLGWETAFPALIASYFTGSKVIFDDADRFSLIVSLPKPVKAFVQALERWTSHRVALHIVPGFGRYEWRAENMIVLRNAPILEDYRKAVRLGQRSSPSGLVIYVNGWLGETRGLPVVLDVMRRAAERQIPIRMILAGRMDGASSEALAALENVEYRGRVGLDEALKIYREVDLVFSYFDPAIPINRLAESNKWGDCVFLNVPFVANSEVETAGPFVKAGAAISVPYDDVDGLFGILAELAEEPRRLESYRTALRGFESEYQPFDTAFGGIVDSYLNERAGSC